MNEDPGPSKGVLLYVINEAYFFLQHRLPAARAARSLGYEIHVAAPADHVWAPEDFDVAEIEKAGFIYHRIELSRRGKNPFREVATIWNLLQLYRKLRPDIVHHLTVKPIIYGGLASRLTAIPATVSSVTGLGQIFVADGVGAAILKSIIIFGYQLATNRKRCRVLVENPDDADLLANVGAVRRDQLVHINGTGIPLDEFKSSDQGGGTPLVILAARLIWEKGIKEFVDAARTLKSKGVDARFALIGDTQSSNPRSVPEDQLRAWQDEGAIEWWGRRDDMPDIFRQSHIVCLPTTYGEGVPRSLIEAAASARPIVTTDTPGCREIVRNDINGLLVPTNDPGALVDALAKLIEDPALRSRMGAAGREIAAGEFSVEEVEQRTLDVYKEVMPST